MDKDVPCWSIYLTANTWKISKRPRTAVGELFLTDSPGHICRLCRRRAQAAAQAVREPKRVDRVPIKLYLQNQAADRFGPQAIVC